MCLYSGRRVRQDGIREIYIQAFISINITIATHSIDPCSCYCCGERVEGCVRARASVLLRRYEHHITSHQYILLYYPHLPYNHVIEVHIDYASIMQHHAARSITQHHAASHSITQHHADISAHNTQMHL